MVDWLRKLTKPPHFEGDEAKTRTASLLNTMLLAFIGGTVIVVVATPFTGRKLVSYVVATVLFFAVWLVMRRGYVRQAAWAVVLGVFLIIAVQTPADGGVQAPAFATTVVIVTLAGLLLGVRAAFIAATGGVLIGAAMVAAESAGVFVQPVDHSSLNHWVFYSVALVFSSVILALALKATDDALKRLRENERQLAERNSALAEHAVELERRGEALEKAVRAYRVLSDCNQNLIRATDDAMLIQPVCDIVVRDGACSLAWIGLADEDRPDRLRLAAQAGPATGYLGVIDPTSVGEHGEDAPMTKAWRSGETVVVNDIESFTGDAKWRTAALDHGLRSVVVLPLRNGEKTLGLLGIYSPEEGRFDEAEVALLDELASDIVFGLMTLRTRSIARGAEELIQQNEERLRQAARVSHIGIFDHDLETDEIYCSDELREMLGWDSERAVSIRDFVAAFHPGDLEAFQKAFEMSHDPRGDGISDVELRIVREDGEVRQLKVRSQTIFSETGGERRAVRTIGAILDMTEHERMQQLVRQSEERLRQAARVSHIGIFDHDHATDTIYWSPEQRAIYGWDADETVLLDKFSEAVHPDDRDRIWAAVQAAHDPSGDGRFDVENRIIRHDGQVRWTLTRSQTYFSGEGEERGPYRTVGAVLDVTEQRQAEERIMRQVQRLDALRAIDIAISGSLNLRLTLGVIVEQVATALQADAVTVLSLDPHTYTLQYAHGRGFRGSAIEGTRLRVGEGLAGRAALEQRTLTVSDLSATDSCPPRKAIFQDEGLRSHSVTPLVVKGQVKGVLEVFHRSTFVPDEDWTAFFEALALQTAIAFDSATMFASLERSNIELSQAYDATIEGWSRALDLRDRETEGHTQRVTEMTLRLARFMGVGEAEIAHIRRGALLHDIGKMGVPDSILHKPGELNEEEWGVMHQHPQLAFEMLAPIAHLRPALDIPSCHHEWWDGTGYPRGLKGNQIPLAARIFAVVDVWDALRSDRPYREAWTHAETLEHIIGESGTHFDPDVVEAFKRLVGES